MRTKDWVMFGLFIGIALFIIGAMISSIFVQITTTEEEAENNDYVPDRASKVVKLIGLSFIITTMVVGGIIGSDLHKYFKLILLIMGLVMLLIFSIGAQFMKWDATPDYVYNKDHWYWGSGMMASSSEDIEEDYSSPPSTPGFELIAVIGAIATVAVASKIRRRK